MKLIERWELTRARLAMKFESQKDKPSRTMITIPVAHGELVDKLTILQIKREKIKNKAQLVQVEKEWSLLYPLLIGVGLSTEHKLYQELLDINRQFWEYHSWQRERWAKVGEQKDEVDTELYWRNKEEHVLNDRRARVKLAINVETKSDIVEQKQFPVYSIGSLS